MSENLTIELSGLAGVGKTSVVRTITELNPYIYRARLKDIPKFRLFFPDFKVLFNTVAFLYSIKVRRPQKFLKSLIKLYLVQTKLKYSVKMYKISITDHGVFQTLRTLYQKNNDCYKLINTHIHRLLLPDKLVIIKASLDNISKRLLDRSGVVKQYNRGSYLDLTELLIRNSNNFELKSKVFFNDEDINSCAYDILNFISS